MKYLEVFTKIKKDIEDHPFLELVTFECKPGIPQDDLASLVSELYEIHPYFKDIKMDAIFNFYKECNGLTLTWKIASHLDDETYIKLEEEWTDMDFPSQKNAILGSIKILPFDDVFLYEQDYFETDPSGDHFTQFGDFTYPGNSFGEMLFIFDLYSDTNCMSFVPDQDNQEPKVICLSDYYVVWDSSRVTFFDSYIYFLAVSRGLIKSRELLFNHYRGDKLDYIQLDSIPFNTAMEPILFKKNKPNE